jgi:putative ABC transport system ATP-binding protein
MALINLESITKIYNKGTTAEVEALKNVSLQIEVGEMLAIMGVSGSGKSTLLHIIACLERYEEGRCYVDNINITRKSQNELAEIRNQKIGIILQDLGLMEDRTVYENVIIPLFFSNEVKLNQFQRLARTALNAVGIENLERRKVALLSGGQRQRVAIARAMVLSPTLLLADEPTSALDEKTATEIMQLLGNLNKNGTTIVVVTHDPSVAKRCQRIIYLHNGEVYDEKNN